MAQETTSALGAEVWVPPPEPGFPASWLQGIWKFTRRKPLGAFGGVLVVVLLVFAAFGAGFTIPFINLHVPRIAPYYYNDYDLLKVRDTKLQGPSLSHIMGTDQLGRDVFSRLLYGARLSVSMGLGVFFISTILSTTLTLTSAYYIRTVDLIMQRVIEVIRFLPELILLIALFSIYGGTPLTFILTLGVINGVNTSRVLRSIVIGLRGMPFIESAKAIGASDKRVILSHILPNVMYYIIVSATQAVAGAIVAEAGLAIIGFGISPTYPTWGNMMNASREFLRVAPWLAIFPAMMIALTIFGFRLMGDALRDVLDPRLRGSR